jgi:hypothetical protein
MMGGYAITWSQPRVTRRRAAVIPPIGRRRDQRRGSISSQSLRCQKMIGA